MGADIPALQKPSAVCSTTGKASIEVGASVIGATLGTRLGRLRGAAIGGLLANNFTHNLLEYACDGKIDPKDAAVNGAASVAGVVAGIATGGTATVPTAEAVRVGLSAGLRSAAKSGSIIGFVQDFVNQQGSIHITKKQAEYSYYRTAASTAFGAFTASVLNGLSNIVSIKLSRVAPPPALSAEVRDFLNRTLEAAREKRINGLNDHEASVTYLLLERLQKDLQTGSNATAFVNAIIKNCRSTYREGGNIKITPTGDEGYSLTPDRFVAVLEALQGRLETDARATPILSSTFSNLIKELRETPLYRSQSQAPAVSTPAVRAPHAKNSGSTELPASVAPMELHRFTPQERHYFETRRLAEQIGGLEITGDRLVANILIVRIPTTAGSPTYGLALKFNNDGAHALPPLSDLVARTALMDLLSKLRSGGLRVLRFGPHSTGKTEPTSLDGIEKLLDDL